MLDLGSRQQFMHQHIVQVLQWRLIWSWSISQVNRQGGHCSSKTILNKSCSTLYVDIKLDPSHWTAFFCMYDVAKRRRSIQLSCRHLLYFFHLLGHDFFMRTQKSSWIRRACWRSLKLRKGAENWIRLYWRKYAMRNSEGYWIDHICGSWIKVLEVIVSL